MTREDAFIADIIANPADDAIRLIYADWLDGQGREEYGEFIRVQCELANLRCEDGRILNETGGSGACRGCVRWRELRQRERDLLDHLSENWSGSPLHWMLDTKPGNQFQHPLAVLRRGFVAEAKCTCQEWLDCGPALVRRHPIERVVLTDKQPVTHTPGLWRWAHDEPNFRHTGHSSLLPGELFDLLDGQPPGHWHFGSVSAAIAALEKAALLWARQTEPAMVSA